MGYEQKGDYDAAIRDYTRGVEVEPECAEADQGRALAHYGKRENDKAWADVKECQRLGGQVHPQFLADLRKASGRDE